MFQNLMGFSLDPPDEQAARAASTPNPPAPVISPRREMVLKCSAMVLL
jgi:hypothetical protein